MIAAVDATGSGQLTGGAIKWVTRGFLPTFASPVMVAELLYTVDNSAILGAFDLKTGKEVWTMRLGTLQKGSPVLADGKIYVTNEDGVTSVYRAGPKFELLAENKLDDYTLSSIAVKDGQLFLRTAGWLWAIGYKGATLSGGPASMIRMRSR